MKLVLLALVNVAVVAGGIAVYDAMKSPAPAAGDAAPASGALGALAARVDRLEAKLDAKGAGSDRTLAARVAELEERVATVAKRPSRAGEAPAAPTASHAPADIAAAGSDAASAVAADPNAPVTDAEVARLRKVWERMEADRERERTLGQLDGLLARLGISLTADQKERVGAELVAHRQRVRELFMQGGGPGGSREETMAAVQEQNAAFTRKLEEFLPAADAQAIAASAQPGPGGRGPGGGGGGPGGGGGGPGFGPGGGR